MLRSAIVEGVDLVAVADPDQAIFEFRQAMPDALAVFGDEIGRGPRLSGNFRSSPAIVRAGERLRSSAQTDEALGPEADNSDELVVFGFDEHDEVADIVRQYLAAPGIDPADAVVLAHRADHAAECAGGSRSAGSSRRAVLVFAEAAVALRTSDDPIHRRRSLMSAERALLRAAGVEARLTVEEDTSTVGLTARWVRDAATRVVFSADPRGMDRADYTSAIRQTAKSLLWPEGMGVTNQALATPPEGSWSTLGATAPTNSSALPWLTVHGAKGREFEAVALVVPRTLRADDAGMTCIDHWEQGSDAESRRVLYVGVTRAKKLLLIGVHREHLDRVSGLLN